MKPALLKITRQCEASFSIRHDTVPYMNNRWHCHADVELIYFKNGSGTQFIGDSIRHFQSGDMFMVGPYLPHYWRFEDMYFKPGTERSADVFVVHFNRAFWGEDFLNLPENKLLRSALFKSERGIEITGAIRDKTISRLELLLNAEGYKRIILLMEILAEIGVMNACPISSLAFQQDLEDPHKERINDIVDYSILNYHKQIRLEEIAAIANISRHAFCRYFKSKTRKTYTRFINEIRIGKACKLLIESGKNLKQICFECGYNNMATFHKFFRLITGVSPARYKNTFLLAREY